MQADPVKCSAAASGYQLRFHRNATGNLFLRELAAEKLLVIYNNAANQRDLKIPIADTPMRGAKELDSMFGSATAESNGDEVRITLPAQTLALFKVR